MADDVDNVVSIHNHHYPRPQRSPRHDSMEPIHPQGEATNMLKVAILRNAIPLLLLLLHPFSMTVDEDELWSS